MHVMLFSDIPPSVNYSAGIVLNKLCGFLLDAGHQVSCFTCMNPDLEPQIPEDKRKRMKFANMDKPNENWTGESHSRAMNKKMAEEVLPKITQAAAAFAKENNADLLWIVEQGQSIILQARPLAKATGLPYVIQTWDSPQWWMKANRYAPQTQFEVMKEYGHALHEAECFIAASWIMEREFHKKYHCKRSKAVVLGFPDEPLPQIPRKEKNAFIIAMAGQIYALEEFKSLLLALQSMNWTYRGKKIYLDIYASSVPPLKIPGGIPGNMRIKGWRVQSELLVELQNADLLYCPYWFDKEYEIVCHTSFPSKLSTYLSVQRPVAVHGPSYASPVIFMKENRAGYCWEKLSDKYIAQELKKVMDDTAAAEKVANGKAAFRRFLTDECMRRNFFDALNIPLPEKAMHSAPKRPLKVVHVNNVDLLGNRFNGYDMLRACADRTDISFSQVVLDKMSDDPNVISLTTNDAVKQMRDLCSDYEQYDSSRALVQPFGRLLRRTRAYAEADIIHYHLLHNGVMSFADLPDMTNEKASVLTVHDPWLVTGHCVHPMECNQWKTGCIDCPDLSRPFAMAEDRTHLMWRIKQRFIESSDIDLIVASKWMEDLVKNSPITRTKRCHRIPFGIDLSLFSVRQDTQKLRAKWNINPHHFVVMFRQDPSPFKGMQYIIEALKALPKAKQVTVLTVGATGLLQELKNVCGQIIELSWITDPAKIAELYSCCDVFLMPSTAEAFGLMAIETLASSKPIIVFEGTSLPEVVHAPDIGIAVPLKDSAALARSIEHLMLHPDEARKRGEMGRELAEREYQFKDYVNRHIDLYQELHGRKSAK